MMKQKKLIAGSGNSFLESLRSAALSLPGALRRLVLPQKCETPIPKPEVFLEDPPPHHLRLSADEMWTILLMTHLQAEHPEAVAQSTELDLQQLIVTLLQEKFSLAYTGQPGRLNESALFEACGNLSLAFIIFSALNDHIPELTLFWEPLAQNIYSLAKELPATNWEWEPSDLAKRILKGFTFIADGDHPEKRLQGRWASVVSQLVRDLQQPEFVAAGLTSNEKPAEE